MEIQDIFPREIPFQVFQYLFFIPLKKIHFVDKEKEWKPCLLR